MNTLISKRSNYFRRFLAVSLLSLAPLAAHADVGLSAGYTGMHDGGLRGNNVGENLVFFSWIF